MCIHMIWLKRLLCENHDKLVPQAGILSSIISKVNGAYVHLGSHPSLHSRKRKQLEVTVGMFPGRFS